MYYLMASVNSHFSLNPKCPLAIAWFLVAVEPSVIYLTGLLVRTGNRVTDNIGHEITLSQPAQADGYLPVQPSM